MSSSDSSSSSSNVLRWVVPIGAAAVAGVAAYAAYRSFTASDVTGEAPKKAAVPANDKSRRGSALSARADKLAEPAAVAKKEAVDKVAVDPAKKAASATGVQAENAPTTAAGATGATGAAGAAPAASASAAAASPAAAAPAATAAPAAAAAAAPTSAAPASAAAPASDFTSLKKQGNTFIKAKKYDDAVAMYTEALATGEAAGLAGEELAKCCSNLCLAHQKRKDQAKRLAAAERCIALDGGNWKGYAHKGDALTRLDRVDDALATYAEGMGAVRSERAELKRSETELLLKGWWHGQVSEENGGFVQEFEWAGDGKSMNLDVLGQKVTAKYTMDCTPTPMHMDIAVPNPGAQKMDPIKYIFKFGVDVKTGQENRDELHMCSPHQDVFGTRPKAFQGPEYVVMARGRAVDPEASKLEGLTEDERVVSYLEELTVAVPRVTANVKIADELQAQIPADQRHMAVMQMKNMKLMTVFKKLEVKYGTPTTATVQKLIAQEKHDNPTVNEATTRLLAALKEAGMGPE